MRTARVLALVGLIVGPLLLAATAGCGGDSGQLIPTGSASPTVPDPNNGGGAATSSSSGSSASGSASASNGTSSSSGATDGGADSGAIITVDGPWPGSQVFFFTFDDQRNVNNGNWGTALTDILRHLNASFQSVAYEFPNERITWGHETSHGIADHIRFAYAGKGKNGFYLMQDRATIVTEPAMHLADVAPRVPPSLKGPQHQKVFVTAASDWKDTPTFVLDEWIASTNGSEVAVDLFKQNLWGTSVRDGVFGTLELTIYALAFGLAVEQVDATYFTKNPITRELLAWNAERAMRLYEEGTAMTPFKSNAQDDYLTKWKTSADAAPLRNFARRLFGSAYAAKVLGITGGVE